MTWLAAMAWLAATCTIAALSYALGTLVELRRQGHVLTRLARDTGRLAAMRADIETDRAAKRC